MRKLIRLSWIVVFVIALLAGCAAQAPGVTVMSLTSLDLQNGDFEGGFREVDGAPELKVAVHWTPWWDANSARPEYKIAAPEVDPRRIHGGKGAQQWFNNWNRHTAGIYQRVSGVPVGKTIRFEGWVQAFSSSKDDFSQSNGRYRVRVGIDPYGGLDPESPDIVWSNGGNAIQPYDAYSPIAVETMARSDRVTVYVWGQAEWALKHNDAYVDDLALYVVDAQQPTPTPAPTSTPEVTSTPGPTAVPGSCPSLEEMREVIREELRGVTISVGIR